mgnify:CR=1 FL=1|jgi:amidase
MAEDMKGKKIHGFTNDVIGDLDATALAALIKNKSVTAEEVVQASINRAKAINPHLNAIVTETYEKGLLQSKNLNDGFFAGVPTFIKDLTNIEGMKTFYGSAAFLNAPISKKTDPIAKQIFAQGFVHLGNSTLPEFGFTCSTEFPNSEDTKNPWNTDYSCGGSSGGAAVLVAAGVVPIAHSADGGGSTRIPASVCGLVGMKASRGRLLCAELFQHQIIDIAIDGVITRSVRDTARFYAEAEKYYKNPKLAPIGLVEGPSKKTFKIGYTNDSLKGLKGDAPTEAVLLKTVKLLEELGHSVKTIELTVPEQFVDDFVYLWEMLAFYTKHMGKPMFGKHYDASKLTTFMHGLAKKHPKNMWKMPFFLYRLKKSYHDYAKMFADMDVDLILTPTLAHTTPKLGHLSMNLEFDEMFPRMTDWACFTPYSNATGAPSISLPMGEDLLNDMPIGIMLWANHGREDLLLDISYQLEEAHPWKKITE